MYTWQSHSLRDGGELFVVDLMLAVGRHQKLQVSDQDSWISKDILINYFDDFIATEVSRVGF